MPVWLSTIIIVVVLLLGLSGGLPIAFCLVGLSAMLCLAFLGPASLFMIANAALSQASSQVLMAVPMFVLMATALEFSGVASTMYNAMHKWAAGFKGGLSMGTVAICTVLAAMSGVAATGTVVMGLLALPEMRQRGYDKSVILGPIVAGGALGVLIPPSVLMIIIGSLSGVSVGALFMGGVFVGLLIAFLSMAYLGVRCVLQPGIAPALPPEERGTLWEKLTALRSLILPILLIVAVLGSIYTGIATPTEAASIGAIGAFICAAINRKLTWGKTRGALFTTLRLSSMIMWIAIGGACYSQLLVATGTSGFISDFLTGLTLSPYAIMSLMLILVFIAGMFIDPIAISMIFIPIFMPTAIALNLDPLWFMLLFTLCTIIGYITPPFGVNLFYMKGIVVGTDISMMDIYRSTMPFVVVMVVALVLCILFPPLLTWLPSKMIG